MKTIVEPDAILNAIIGEQMVKDAEYRLMNYVFEVEMEDGLLLHNVITGQLIYLSETEKDVLCGLPLKPDERIEHLIKCYFLVPTGFNEYEFVRGYRKILQQIERNKEKPITKYTIFPTTCCNAHCFYCFESDYVKMNMDEDTAKKVVEFIHQHADNKQVTIGWFGGEPTVAVPCIDMICEGLKKLGVAYSSSMVSNGYLFTEQLIKKAVDDWKLKNIQITLDGTEEVYNKTKNFTAPGSAYERVTNNILLMLQSGIEVTVLLNLDYYNSEDLFKLVDELAVRFREYKNFRVSSHVLFNDEGYEKVHHTDGEEEELIERNYALADYMKKAGLSGNVLGAAGKKGKLPKLQYLHCMANDNGSVVIAPDGSLHKCEHIPNGLTNYARVDSGLIEEADIDEWFEPGEEERCANCILFPCCFVPEKCTDHQKCHPIDFEKRIDGFKELSKKLYYGSDEKEVCKA